MSLEGPPQIFFDKSSSITEFFICYGVSQKYPEEKFCTSIEYTIDHFYLALMFTIGIDHFHSIKI